MKKNRKWMKPRHRFVTFLLWMILGPYMRIKYRVTFEKLPNQGKRAYLILMNHQTAFDQFFVGMIFKHPVYYLASEDLFSNGWVSKLIRFLVAPIPIKKQTLDLQAVKNCILVAREGGSICIAPEGNRTYHGRPLYMKPGVASLAKKLGLPIAIFRIEGGYGVQPRWSDVTRKGSMHCRISRLIEPEEYKQMSSEELFRVIETEMYVDEAQVTGEFHHKKNAEFLERAIYTCPWCGFSPFESNGDRIQCKTCGREIRHLPTKELEGVGFQFPHRFVADWYLQQNELVNQTDLTTLTEAPVFQDSARLSKVIPYKHKVLLKKSTNISLYGDRITIDDRILPFEQTHAVVVLGRNKLNIYYGDELLQLKGGKRFNALKYVNFFHRYKNMQSGDPDEKFLGL
ncbi:MAG: 1-acyl-sn-glycerol-3-phosphate acyltransferase [Oscillospiraceae bacterium]|nr:1-acyl-sn-glycerol-3-phosphate acyltransferase [Oscillospiraceae bacterium]